jgi:hypothetical protein
MILVQQAASTQLLLKSLSDDNKNPALILFFVEILSRTGKKHSANPAFGTQDTNLFFSCKLCL